MSQDTAENVDQVYQERMIGHWSTFVSRSELEELVMAGVSHVRIPVGKVSQSVH